METHYKFYIITEVTYYMKVDHNEGVCLNHRETPETIKQRGMDNKPIEEIFLKVLKLTQQKAGKIEQIIDMK